MASLPHTCIKSSNAATSPSAQIASRSPLPSHARAHTAALYMTNTATAVRSEVYIVDMLTLTSPVARLQIKKNAKPFLLIASSKGGTAALWPVELEKKAISTTR